MPDGLDQLLSPEALEQLLEGCTPEGMRRLMGLAWQEPACLLVYLPAHTLIAVDERRHCLAHGQQWFDHASDHHAEVSGELGVELPAVLHRAPEQALATTDAFAGFDLAELHESDNHANSFDLASRPVPAYPNQFGKLA